VPPRVVDSIASIFATRSRFSGVRSPNLVTERATLWDSRKKVCQAPELKESVCCHLVIVRLRSERAQFDGVKLPPGPVSMSKMSNWKSMLSSLRFGSTYFRTKAGSFGERNFAHSHDVRIMIEHLLPHLLEVFVYVWTVAVNTGSMLPRRVRVCYRRVWKTCGLGYHIDHIHSEATDALVEPEAHVVVYSTTQFRIIPIEIWLFCRATVVRAMIWPVPSTLCERSAAQRRAREQ
jgi:hypothetical protein